MAIGFVLLVFILVFYFIYIPVYIGNSVPTSVIIEEGQSLRMIARLLKENRLIRSELIFMAYVKLSSETGNLKAGKYNFAGRFDVPDITSILVKGLSESEDIRLLIPEGFNVWEIDKRLVGLGLIKEGEFSSKYYNEEGYLFPDSYNLHNFQLPIVSYQSGDYTKELREKMADNFKNKTSKLLAGLTREEQKKVIIIASILEKEARGEQDMHLVAGIIYKRLELGILLQIDATVVYGACRRYIEISIYRNVENCDVTFQGVAREIKIDGPYNTYTRKGLPPKPISNPGLKAIEAALNPQESDYLYYLSTRDGSQMIYSRTSGEHAANRKKYLGI